MKKRVLCCLLMLCMVITMAPAMAWAGTGEVGVTLNIDDGSITITETGYTQGSGDEVPHTGSYVITQSNINAATGNTITVKSGEHDITIQALNMAFSAALTEDKVSSFQIFSGATVNLTLVGSNTLVNNTDYGPGLFVQKESVLNIDADDDQQVLTATGKGQNASGIGGIGYGTSLVMEKAAGKIIINGGTVTAKGGTAGSGMGASHGYIGEGVTINGGVVTAIGGSADAPYGSIGISLGGNTIASTAHIEITGGLVYANGLVAAGAYKYKDSLYSYHEQPIIITGGNVIFEGKINGGIGSNGVTDGINTDLKQKILYLDSEQANASVSMSVDGVDKSYTTDAEGRIGLWLTEAEHTILINGAPYVEQTVLDINKGSIAITGTGYTQGSAAETEWDSSNSNHEIIITGTATTANTITVNGGNPTLIFRGLNVTRNDSVSSSNPVIAVNSDATIKLNGNNTIDSSRVTKSNMRHNIISIGGTAKLSVTSDNNGKLTMKRSHYTYPVIIGTGGTFELISGTVDITGTIQTKKIIIQDGLLKAVGTDNSSYIAVNTTDLNLKGGTLEATGKINAVDSTNFAMSGGICKLALTDTGTCLKATNCNISGGTLDFSTASITGTTSITGGNINSAPITDVARTRTELYFVNEAGTLLKNTEVKVTEGVDNTWTAQTNANGVVITYLDNSTTSIKAAVGNGEEHEYQLQTRNGKRVALIGTECICDSEVSNPGIQWTGADSFEMYGGLGTYSIDMKPSLKKADGCAAPFHPGYDVFEVTVEVYVDDVKQETASDYATYSNGKLTLNEKGTNYTVKLIAKSENGKLTQEKTVEVIQYSEKGFNLISGGITISADETYPSKTVYTQGSVKYTAEEGETVAITGQGTTTNKLTITSGTANVLLDNVKINDTTKDKSGATGIIAIKGGTLNVKLKGTNTLARVGCVIYVGKQGSTEPSEAVLNISCSEEVCSELNCPHSLTVKNTYSDVAPGFFAQTATIGGARDDSGASGTITLQSGKLIVSAASDAATIGSPSATANNETYIGTVTYMYDINITGGYLDATNTGSNGTVIGLGRFASADSIANINITGGTVNATSTDASTAIGAATYSDGMVNLKIGSDSSNDNSSPVVNAYSENDPAIGVRGGSYCGMVIEIKSGTVTAVGDQVGIGFSMSSDFANQTGERSITITGGDVTAEGAVGIGAYGPGNADRYNKPCDVDITIGGNSVVNATGSTLAIGVNAMSTDSQVDITIEGSAQVTAESPNGIAIGSILGTKLGSEQSAKEGSTKVTITGEASVDLSGKVAISSASEDLTADISSKGEINITGEAEEAIAIQGGTTVNVTDGEGNTTVITVPDTVGSVTVPAEKLSEVEVKQDGSISLPGGTTITGSGEEAESVTIPESVGTITVPNDSIDEISADGEGNLNLPTGSVITKGEGDEKTTITLPSGGQVAEDGTPSSSTGNVITENTDGTVTVEDKNGNKTTINPPEGSKIEIEEDGTVKIPAGSEVTDKDGNKNTMGNGGTITEDGTVNEKPSGGGGGIYIPPTEKPATDPVQSGNTTTTDMSGSTVSKDGQTTTTIDKQVADKLVETAVKNNSEEIVINAVTKNQSAASSTKASEVTIPVDTLQTIAEKTNANITIKTNVAEVKLDNKAAEAVASQAQTGTVTIVAEKVKEDTNEVHFELKVVSSSGEVISDFNGGNVAVTVNVPDSLKGKKMVCVYIDGDGYWHKVPGELNANGTYTFTTGHFSTYAIMLEEEADAAIAEQQAKIKKIIKGVEATTLKATSSKTSKGIKITWTKSKGYKVDYFEIYRSTKKNSFSKKPFYTTKSSKAVSYTNTKDLKKGTKYYYKVRGVRVIDGQKYYTEYSTKAIRTW